ncbi:TfoX/Sxy family protein [Pseudonocardia kongjuensis]|uniref:TfoX/Sxy family protein n=1 Tax=Pseudonocardia kongjuensis TaxID=102227 RepID=A0ABN1Y277_9PSEU
MAYDEGLAARIRAGLAAEPRVAERRMFGGLAFLVGGHMAVAVSGSGGLMVRVDPRRSGELLGRPRASPMVMNGRELTGWLRVVGEPDPDDLDGPELADWLAEGVGFVRGLPPK